MEWLDALNQAINYMEEHLLEELSCTQLAAQVHISSFHFQRTFSLLTGRTVGEYIRGRRLTLAGQELAGGRISVLDVALKYGYESPESFAKAFRRFHGVSPIQAKCFGTGLRSDQRLTIKIVLEGGSRMDYKIVEKDAFRVVVKLERFTDEESDKGPPAFWTEYRQAGLLEKVRGQFGVCMQAKEGEPDWAYGIGCEESLAAEIPEGFTLLEIPAYTWAIFPCIGPMPYAIQETWKTIYNEWLPQSKYELISGYDLEYYTDADNQKADYYSEIWIPIRVK